MNHTYEKTSLKNKCKYMIPILLIVTVVALFSGATYAYVYSSSEEITNKFVVKKTDIQLIETVDATEVVADGVAETQENVTTKKDVKVKNIGESTVHVRIELVEQIIGASGAVKANTTDESYFEYTGMNTSEWVQIGDYYYYKKPLASKDVTSVLFATAKQKATAHLEDGEHASLIVLTEAIQLNGVTDAWGVTLDEAGGGE